MAKILGELENAQLENVVGTAGLGTPTGRVVIDTTSPMASVFKYYDGSAWQTVQTVASTALVTQNSGKSVVVNWATSLNQKVILTADCVISFTGAIAGQVHTLIIVQNTMGTLPNSRIFNFTFDMKDQATQGTEYQPTKPIPIGRAVVYRWLNNAQIQTGFSTAVPYAQMTPATLPATLATGIDISGDGNFVAMGRTTTPFSTYYNLFSFPFGTQLSPFGNSAVTPAAAAAQVRGVSFSKDGRAVFYASGTTPFIQGFQLDRGVGVGTQIANPGTLPAGAANCIAMHPAGLYVGVGHATTPFMSIYPWTGDYYGTKATNPASLPAAAATALAWCDQGDYIAAASQTSPFIQVWNFSGDDGNSNPFGLQVGNPGALPTGGPAGSLGKGIAWRPQGDYIAMAMTVSPFLYVVPFDRASGSFGAALTITALSGAATCVQWSKDGNFLIVGTGTSPFCYVYDFSSATIGSSIGFLSGSVAGQVNDIVVHPTNDYFVLALNVSPFTTSWVMPTKDRNYLKMLE